MLTLFISEKVRGGDNSCNCCCGNNDSLIIYLLNKILDTVSNTDPPACPTTPWPTTAWPTATGTTTPWPTQTWPTETTLSSTWPTESDGDVPVVPTEPPGYEDGVDFNPPPTPYPGPF